MRRNRMRVGPAAAAIGAVVLTLAGCASTGDLLGNFAGTANGLGYESCELRDQPAEEEEEAIEAIYVCSVDPEHGLALFVFDTTISREQWVEVAGAQYRDLGVEIITHDRWAIAGNDAEDLAEVATTLGASPASLD